MSATELAFVLSAPRSGSTWLRTMLAAHPEILATEQRLFGPHFDVVHDAGAARPRLRITLDAAVDALLAPYAFDDLPGPPSASRDQLVAELARAFVAFGRSRSGRRVLVDKVTPYPGTAAAVRAAIERVFPVARVVHLVRDPRDVLTSGIFHWLTKRKAGDPGSPFRTARDAWLRGAGPAPAEDRFADDAEIAEWGGLWAETAALAFGDDAAGRAEPVLRYESLLARPIPTLTRLLEGLGVASDPATVARCVEAGRFERMSGGRRPGEADPTAHVRRGVAGDWRNWLRPGDLDALARHVGPVLERACAGAIDLAGGGDPAGSGASDAASFYSASR